MDVTVTTDREQEHLREHLKHIGNTPLIPISLTIHDRLRRVYLKLEGANLGGSVKVRTAHALLNDLEARGLLNKNSIILESTSGNLGVALSMLACANGYNFLAIVDPKTTAENIAKMRTFGAQIEMVEQQDEAGGYLLARLARVHQLLEASPSYVWTNQYANQANPLAHYRWTGPEIYQQMHEHLDVVFVAVSTGGTLAGISQFMREVSPQTRMIGVDAHGSVIFGGLPAPRMLTGIGASRPSSFLAPDSYDQHMLVHDEEAFAFCRALDDATALKVGGSSGATLAACSRYLAQHPDVQDVVCICPDTGDNYAATIYNDEWLRHHKFSLLGVLGDVQAIQLDYSNGYCETTPY